MSANNWAICPRCLLKAKQAKDALQGKAADAYGVLPLEEFDQLRREAEAPIDMDALRTFREDYAFWIDGDGNWFVRYDGSCTVCGLSHELGQTVNLLEAGS